MYLASARKGAPVCWVQKRFDKEILTLIIYGALVQLHSMYHGIPRSVVEKLVSMCPSCQLCKPKFSRGPLRILFMAFIVSCVILCRQRLHPAFPQGSCCSFVY